MKRYQAALEVLEAVPNFATIARALTAAADEAASEGIGAERDPAVRVVAYRLARLCRVDEISYGYDPTTLADTFCTLMNECKARAKEAASDELVFPLPEVISPAEACLRPGPELELSRPTEIRGAAVSCRTRNFRSLRGGSRPGGET